MHFSSSKQSKFNRNLKYSSNTPDMSRISSHLSKACSLECFHCCSHMYLEGPGGSYCRSEVVIVDPMSVGCSFHYSSGRSSKERLVCRHVVHWLMKGVLLQLSTLIFLYGNIIDNSRERLYSCGHMLTFTLQFTFICKILNKRKIDKRNWKDFLKMFYASLNK